MILFELLEMKSVLALVVFGTFVLVVMSAGEEPPKGPKVTDKVLTWILCCFS